MDLDTDAQIKAALRGSGGGGESYAEFCSLFSALGDNAALADLELACPAGLPSKKSHVLRYTQTEAAIEVVITGKAVEGGEIRCDIESETLALLAGGRVIVQGRLYAQIQPSESSWSVKGQITTIDLRKAEPAYWKDVWFKPDAQNQSPVQQSGPSAATEDAAEELQVEQLADGVHCGGDVMASLPTQQFDNFVDFEDGISESDDEDCYLKSVAKMAASSATDSCSRAAADSLANPAINGDAEMDKIAEMLLAQTATNATGRMPLPVDWTKAFPKASPSVDHTTGPSNAAADSDDSDEMDKIGEMLLAQSSANATDRMPLPVDRTKASPSVDHTPAPSSEPIATQVGRAFENEAEAALVLDAEKMAREALAGFDADTPECVLEEDAGQVIRMDMAGGLNTSTDCFPGEIPDLEAEIVSPKIHSTTGLLGPSFVKEEDKKIRQMCLNSRDEDDADVAPLEMVASPESDNGDEVAPFAMDPDFDYDNVELDPWWH